MNPKIKRKLKTYNDRFCEMGFKMSVEINSDPSFDFTVALIKDNSLMDEKEIMKLISWPKDNTISLWMYDSSIHDLETPQPVSDFLYYAFSIIEDLRKEKANENKN